MIVDVGKIDPTKFSVTRCDPPEIGPAFLVKPLKTTHEWEATDLKLRSVLVRESDGQVVSGGFPKFFNFGEDKLSDTITMQGFEDQDVIVTPKYDGTLIIRSVVNGKVHFRTRGAATLGPFEEPVMTLIRSRYLKLLDPTLTVGDDAFLLFEYCGPSNQIVIRYGTEFLVGLAFVHYTNKGPRIWPFPTGLPASNLVYAHVANAANLNLRRLEDIQTSLCTMSFAEGYVVWTRLPWGAGYHLTKFKTPWYLRLHALRSCASPRLIREFCLHYNVRTLVEFRQMLAADGFDWEVVDFLLPCFHAVEAHFDSVSTRFRRFDEVVAERNLMALPNRKAKALACKQLAADLNDEFAFHYSLALVTDRPDEARDMREAAMLDVGVNTLRHIRKEWSNGRTLSTIAKETTSEGDD